MRRLLTARWAGLLLGLLAVVVLCVLAARWQYDRYQDKSARNAEVAAATAQDPVPVAELVPAGGTPATGDEWRPVTASGTYDVDRTLLVRLRPLDGSPGAHVLVPLVAADGTAVLVDRGWVSRRAVDDDPAAAPAPPPGEVTVTGRLRLPENGSGTGGDPASGLVRRIDVAAIAATLPYPVRGGFVERVEEQPGADPAPVVAPVPMLGTALNLAYTVQWYAFAVIAVVVFVLLARQEARGQRTGGRRRAEEGEVPAWR